MLASARHRVVGVKAVGGRSNSWFVIGATYSGTYLCELRIIHLGFRRV